MPASPRGRTGPPNDVAVVAVDDVTFNELRAQWPFRRSLHARVIDRLRKAGAKVIAVDIQFTEPTKLAEDNALIDAVDRAPRIVLATTEVDEKGRSNVLGGDELLNEIGARSANAILNQDQGGVQRRIPYSFDGLESFAVAASELATGRQVPKSAFGGEDAWIDYLGPPGTIPTYSYSRVLNGRFPADAFKGRVVVVGAAAPRLQDVHPVPTSGDELMAGPEVQANAISTVLRGLPLDTSSEWVDIAIIVLLSILAPLIGLRWGVKWMLPVMALVAVAYVGVVALAFRDGLILPAVHPLGALLTGVVGDARGGADARHARAPACPRRVRPLRPRGRGRRRAPAHRRRPAPRRHPPRGDGPVLRPARLHRVRRDAPARRGDRGAQPLPGVDERRDPRQRRHARRLHGRRDHGRVRRPARAARPRRPGAGRRARDGRRAARRASTPGWPSRSAARRSRWASGSTPAT